MADQRYELGDVVLRGSNCGDWQVVDSGTSEDCRAQGNRDFDWARFLVQRVVKIWSLGIAPPEAALVAYRFGDEEIPSRDI